MVAIAVFVVTFENLSSPFDGMGVAWAEGSGPSEAFNALVAHAESQGASGVIGFRFVQRQQSSGGMVPYMSILAYGTMVRVRA